MIFCESQKITGKIRNILVILITLTFLSCTTLEFYDAKIEKVPEPDYHGKARHVALVLGGGGARGAAHVGVIEELTKAGIKIDLIIGCSAGSIVGSLYASNPNIDHLKKVLLTKKFDDFIEIDFTQLPFALTGGQRLMEFLNENIKQKKIEHLSIPFIPVATELGSGRLTPFARGPLVPSVLASAAVPGFFLPVKLYGRKFVDCGVTGPVPVAVAERLGVDYIIAVDIGEYLPSEKPSHLVGVLMRSLEIAYVSLNNFSIKAADVVINVPFQGIGMFTDNLTQKIYERGKKATLAILPKIKHDLKKIRKGRKSTVGSN